MRSYTSAMPSASVSGFFPTTLRWYESKPIQNPIMKIPGAPQSIQLKSRVTHAVMQAAMPIPQVMKRSAKNLLMAPKLPQFRSLYQ